jgi:hypothetical protein
MCSRVEAAKSNRIENYQEHSTVLLSPVENPKPADSNLWLWSRNNSESAWLEKLDLSIYLGKKSQSMDANQHKSGMWSSSFKRKSSVSMVLKALRRQGEQGGRPDA